MEALDDAVCEALKKLIDSPLHFGALQRGNPT
jgi:hypothetical protein